MEEPLAQLKSLASSVDEATRAKLVDSMRSTLYSIESQEEILDRITGLHLQAATVRTGINTKVFEILSKNKNSISLEQIAKESNADVLLTARLMRHLASTKMVEETAPKMFRATNVTRVLANPGEQAGIKFYFDMIGPMYQQLPEFLKKIEYKDFTDKFHTVHQDAWNTKDDAFTWLTQNPTVFSNFNQYMARQLGTGITWLSTYPIEQDVQGMDPERTLFVDIGGSIGHQCVELIERYPNVPGRVVLQDLPQCIDEALKSPRLEAMVHDMYKPQPVKGAKIYYMKLIMHMLPDDQCRKLLQLVKEAMSEDSILVIDDMVFPEWKVSWQASQFDLTMMCAHAAMERTQSQWQALLDSVDLKIRDVYVYEPSIHKSSIAVVPKGSGSSTANGTHANGTYTNGTHAN